jgi:hypothetical protein
MQLRSGERLQGAGITVNRKLGVLVAAILLPGGLIALFGAWMLKRLSETPRGRKALAAAKERMPAWAMGMRQAA